MHRRHRLAWLRSERFFRVIAAMGASGLLARVFRDSLFPHLLERTEIDPPDPWLTGDVSGSGRR